MNRMKLSFCSHLENEAFARTSVIAFLMPLSMSVEEVMEIKTIMAEAIVNAMIHGYEGREDGEVIVSVSYDEQKIVTIRDAVSLTLIWQCSRFILQKPIWSAAGWE